jgi:hypothetical protein
MAAKPKKKIVRREWSKDDVRQLKTMAKAKAGVTKIAKALTNAGRYEREGGEIRCFAINACVTQTGHSTSYGSVARSRDIWLV